MKSNQSNAGGVWKKWTAGWATLSFEAKHTVAAAIAGVVATIVFSIAATVISAVQLFEAKRTSEQQATTERFERNKRELQMSLQAFGHGNGGVSHPQPLGTDANGGGGLGQ